MHALTPRKSGSSTTAIQVNYVTKPFDAPAFSSSRRGLLAPNTGDKVVESAVR